MTTTIVADEVSSLIIDIGSKHVKVGYSGDERPLVVCPSRVGLLKNDESESPKRVFGDLALYKPQSDIEILPVISINEVRDWDHLKALLDYCVISVLGEKWEEHPVLLVDNPLWTKEIRDSFVALFFEKLNVPALFVGRSSVSSAFSVGKHTGLVVDLGFGGVRIGPVYDGYLVKSGVLFEAALGGDHLTGETRLLISKSENELHIPQEIASKQSVGLGESAVFTKVPNFKVKESFLKYHRTIILEDLKEAIIQVSETSPFNERDLAVRPLRYYEMPDGFCKGFGVDRFRLGELLFDPNFESSVPSSSIDVSFDEISNDPVEDASNIQSATNASVNTKDSKAIDGLIPLILKSIAACDVEIRSSLLSNVLLTGGGSQIGGLVERVAFELAKVPAIGRIRVQAAGSTTVERRFASWIGASILASLGSFSQLWLTRAEYKEHGASYIDRKCP